MEINNRNDFCPYNGRSEDLTEGLQIAALKAGEGDKMLMSGKVHPIDGDLPVCSGGGVLIQGPNSGPGSQRAELLKIRDHHFALIHHFLDFPIFNRVAVRVRHFDRGGADDRYRPDWHQNIAIAGGAAVWPGWL